MNDDDIVLVLEWFEGELRVYPFTPEKQVHVREIVIRDNVSRKGAEYMSLPIEGMTAAAFVENEIREFNKPWAKPPVTPTCAVSSMWQDTPLPDSTLTVSHATSDPHDYKRFYVQTEDGRLFTTNNVFVPAPEWREVTGTPPETAPPAE